MRSTWKPMLAGWLAPVLVTIIAGKVGAQDPKAAAAAYIDANLERSDAFADVDAVLHWHADDENNASPATSLANVSVNHRRSLLIVTERSARARHGRQSAQGRRRKV
jgi:hypothetical protein